MHTQDYLWGEKAPQSSNYIIPAIRRLVARHEAKRILDAGCGNGTLAGALAADGYEVTGVDADTGGLEIAKRAFPQVHFERGLFSEPPIKTDYDAVVSTEVVEHLYSPHELVAYAYSALRPGGVFIISTPYHGYLKNVALAMTHKWDHHHTVLWHGGHIKFFSRSTLTTLIERSGFKVSGFVGVGRLPQLWKSMILVSQKPS